MRVESSKKIEIYAPDEGSGTFDYFFESIIPFWGKENQQANPRLYKNDKVYQPTSDDNVILNAIKDNEYAIGYFGFAYYVDNPGKIKAVSVADDGSDHIEPSFESVADYPIARPLHIYTDGVPRKGEVINKYLQYIFSAAGQAIIPEVGYIKLSLVNQSIVDEQKKTLNGTEIL